VFSPDILRFEVKTRQRCSGVFDVGLVSVVSKKKKAALIKAALYKTF